MQRVCDISLSLCVSSPSPSSPSRRYVTSGAAALSWEGAGEEERGLRSTKGSGTALKFRGKSNKAIFCMDKPVTEEAALACLCNAESKGAARDPGWGLVALQCRLTLRVPCSLSSSSPSCPQAPVFVLFWCGWIVATGISPLCCLPTPAESRSLQETVPKCSLSNPFASQTSRVTGVGKLSAALVLCPSLASAQHLTGDASESLLQMREPGTQV